MKTLFATTALALIMAAPVAAQTAGDNQADAPAAQADAEMGMGSGYLSGMQQGDFLASELMDATIYAPATGDDAAASGAAPQGTAPETDTARDGQTPANEPGQRADRWGQPVNTQDLDNMENIGSVNDLVVDREGNVQAVLVDVGGFLGIGARQVALSLDDVQLVSDAEDSSQVYVISMLGADTLESAPEYEHGAEGRSAEHDAAQQPDGMAQDTADTAWRGDRDPMVAPDVEREGYQQAEVNEISADEMIGANLYDAQDENVGNVSDVVLGPDGEAQYVVADVGGFLGLGAHTVAIGFDEITVMHDEGWSDLRLYVDVTEDALESMPEYTSN